MSEHDRLQDRLAELEPYAAAVAWAGDKTVAEAWASCHRGDWMLWWLVATGHDCTTAGYWCAERARQSALRALPPSPGRDAIAGCAPVTTRATAVVAWAEAAGAAVDARVVDAAWAAAGAAAWAAEASLEAETAAHAAEMLAIADYVRAHYHP